ncbi:MAG TPA: hypothetical protein VF331_12925 [Polyangiales bacterium]|jgi:hypothetical protein
MPMRNWFWSVSFLGLVAAVGCDDGVQRHFRPVLYSDAGTYHSGDGADAGAGAGAAFDAAQLPGVCELDKCPKPDVGIACCTPDAVCGTDQTSTGALCVANAGARKNKICALAECPLPDVGNACCMSNGDCGRDPLGTGALCFANPPKVNIDGGAPLCNPKKCAQPQVGSACCTAFGQCGADTTGTGYFCIAPQGTLPMTENDAGSTPISTTPPKDPTVDGQCPSYIGVGGVPSWGCCSKFGMCGIFAANTCLLPAGTSIPLDPYAREDDGGLAPGRCIPKK